jgi:hypothetical protein
VWQQWEHSRNGARNISIHTAGNQWQHGSQHLTHPGGEITRHDSETAAQMDVIESGPSKGVTIELKPILVKEGEMTIKNCATQSGICD